MSPRRIAFWLLASAGVAVGHISGYVVAHPDTAAREVALGGHAYLPVVASILVPTGILIALGWAVHTARTLGLSGQIRARRLAVAQIGLFLIQEFGERALMGDGATAAFSERGVWLGLLAQIVVAFLVTRAINVVRRVVRCIVSSGRLASSVPRLVPTQLLPVLAPIAPATVAVGLRAPPVGCHSN